MLAPGASRAARRSIAVLALFAVSGTARAHGPAPAALDRLRPGLVRTSVGLALAQSDGTFEYVCPSRWDGNPLAPAVASADAVIVLSAGIAYRSTDLCTFTPVTGPDVYVTAVERWEDGFAIVAEDHPRDREPDRSHLLRVDATGAIAAVPFDGAIDGVREIDSMLWVAGSRPNAFVGRFAGSTWTALPIRDVPARRWLPRAADRSAVWLAAQEPGGVRLVAVGVDGAIEEGELARMIHGPVWDAGRWIAVIDGVLHARVEARWQAAGAVDWTCLQTRDGEALACTLPALLALRDGATEPIFSVSQLAPPRACGDVAACERDWAHFGGEAGWLDTAAADRPLGERRPFAYAVDPGARAVSATCAVAPRGSPLAVGVLAAIALLAHRRRRDRRLALRAHVRAHARASSTRGVRAIGDRRTTRHGP